MQVEQVVAEGLKREFKVTVPAGEIEQRVRARLEKLAKTVRLPGLPTRQGAAAPAQEAVRSLDPGRGPGGGGRRRFQEDHRRERASSGTAPEDRGHLVRRGQGPRVRPEGRGPAGGAAGRAVVDQPDPPGGRDAGRQGRAGDRELRQVAPEVRDPGRAAARGGRRPAPDRLRGQDRRHAVRRRRRQGLPAPAGLRRHGARLRGAARGRAARRDARGQGDLPGRLRPAGDLRQGRRLHGHGQRGQGARSR